MSNGRTELAGSPSPLHHSALSSFGKALIVAAAIHGLLVLRWSSSIPTNVQASRRDATELQVEIEPGERKIGDASATLNPVDAAHAVSERAAGGPSAAVASTARLATARAVASSAAPLSSEAVAMLEGDGTPSGAARNEQSAPVATSAPSIDLGLDGHLLRLRSTDAPAKPPPRRDLSAELEQSLNATMAVEDVQRGFARGNALIGPLNSAVRGAGPADGQAVIRVTLNSAGELSELKLLRGEPSDWAAAMQSFREQAKRKRVRLPIGSQGLRVTFDVSTKLTRPSGSAVESSAVGVKRPSLAPNGLTFRGEFDAADLSGKKYRMVSAKVLSEEVL